MALTAIFIEVSSVNVLALMASNALGGQGLELLGRVLMATLAGDRLVPAFQRKRCVFGMIEGNLGPGVALEVTVLAGFPKIALVDVVLEVAVGAIVAHF